MTARRELRLAVLVCLLGSALVLYAVDRTWFSVAEAQQVSIDAVRTAVKGHRIVSGAQALGYVGLAGVVALAATRRTGRVLVGLLVLSAGVGVVVVIARALSAGLSERGVGALRPGGCGVGPGGCFAAFTDPKASAGWAWLALAGGVLLALSGLLVAVRGRRWAALSSSYSAPAARAVEPPVTDKGVWDALDRGEDPT